MMKISVDLEWGSLTRAVGLIYLCLSASERWVVGNVK